MPPKFGCDHPAAHAHCVLLSKLIYKLVRARLVTRFGRRLKTFRAQENGPAR